MKFFRSLFSKNTYQFLTISKEVVIALILVILPIFYPTTAKAGLFSIVSNIAADKAMAKANEIPDAPNSQNMPLPKPVINADPAPGNSIRPILATENALVAEIGPSGTASEIDKAPNTQISLYVVRSGDTLSEIAEMFDVSSNTIIWANNLSRNPTLKEGQMLVILPITGVQHVVKKGDTLKSIVNQYIKNDTNEVLLKEVLQYNGLSRNSTLVVGSTIIIPDAELEASVPSKSPTVSTAAKISAREYALRYYRRPIDGGRTSQKIHGHNGVDLAAPEGTPIYAAADGVVIANLTNGGWNGGYGNYVIISHANGTQTLYAHNSVNYVTVGETVKKGDRIARIGMTGKTTGAHVHFEIRGATNPF
jgi:murein DD-endopeptidase MepM/ murein hydrolase activator NlpD